MNLVDGDWPMFDAAGHDQQLAFFQPNLPVTKIHAEASLNDQEKLVLMFMVMPDELALKLDQFDLLTIQFANDPGVPVVVELGEFLLDIYFFHRLSTVKIPQGVALG
jgi:hypothetical protein